MISTRVLRKTSPYHDSLWVKLYRYRWLIHTLVLRDLKLRYRGSFLGVLWTLLNPLLFMAVYTLVFSVFLRFDMRHYHIFLLSGLLPWIWFAGAIQQGSNSIVEGSIYIGRSLFPAEILPVIPVLSNMMNFIFSLPLLFVFLAFSQVDAGWRMVALPVVMLAQLLLTVGLVFIIATYSVFFRDLQYLVSHVLTLLFFLVPIMYPLTAVPENIRPFVVLNPMAIVAASYQNIFFYDSFPDWPRLGYVYLFALAMCWLGKRVFDHHNDVFAEYI